MWPKIIFGGWLAFIGLLYLWLAYESVAPGLQSGDWVAYLGAILFLAVGVVAALAAINLFRTKRR